MKNFPQVCVVLQKWLYYWSSPQTVQAIPVAEPHGGFIRTRWAVLPYKIGRVEKHWAGFSQAYSGGTKSGWSTHFLSLPFPGMSERSQAKKNQTCSGFLDRLGLKQCGNYGWQEGRCAVESGGAARRNHPVPRRATKKLKQINRLHWHFFPLTFPWHCQSRGSWGLFYLMMNSDTTWGLLGHRAASRESDEGDSWCHILSKQLRSYRFLSKFLQHYSTLVTTAPFSSTRL